MLFIYTQYLQKNKSRHLTCRPSWPQCLHSVLSNDKHGEELGTNKNPEVLQETPQRKSTSFSLLSLFYLAGNALLRLWRRIECQRAKRKRRQKAEAYVMAVHNSLST